MILKCILLFVLFKCLLFHVFISRIENFLDFIGYLIISIFPGSFVVSLFFKGASMNDENQDDFISNEID